MAIIDLYTPRVEAETQRSLGREKLTVDTLNEAAKNLFQYSLQKQEIDKAYAEIQAKADALNKENYWKDKMNANELASRRVNAAAISVAHGMNDPAAIQNLEDAFTDYSGSRPNWPVNPQTGVKQPPPDLVDHLVKMTIDPNTGGYTAAGARIAFDATRSQSPMGQMIADLTKLRESGVSEDDPRIATMKDAMVKATATDINQQAGEMLRTVWEQKGPTAAIGLYEYWKTLGTGGTTNVIKMPGEAMQKDVVDTVMLNKKLDMIRGMYNQLKSKYGANWFNKPTGIGAETVQGILTRVGGSDPLITEFQKAVNDYQQDRVRAITGAQHSDQEYQRYIGTMVSGGSMIGNNQSQEAFESTLDMNQKWGKERLKTLLEYQSGTGQRVPPESVTNPPAPDASSENQSGTKQNGNPPAPDLNDLRKKRDELLRKKADAAKSGLSGKPGNLKGPLSDQPRIVGPQSSISPPMNVALFNRALDYAGPPDYSDPNMGPNYGNVG